MGSSSSTLRQVEAIIYDYTQREQSLADKMHKLKMNFFQAMKNDDEFVSKGVQPERRSASRNRHGSQASRQANIDDHLLGSEGGAIGTIYREVVQTFDVLFERERANS